MNKRELKIITSFPYEIIVYVSFIYMMVFTVFFNSFLPFRYAELGALLYRIGCIIRVVLAFCFGIRVLVDGVSKRRFIIILIMFALSLPIYYKNHDFMLFDLFFIALAFSDVIDYKKMANIAFYSLLACVMILAFFHFSGEIQEIEYDRSGTIRHTFGFTHPNSLGRAIMLLVFLYVLIRGEKIGKKDIFIIIVAALITKIFPDSNTSTLVILLLTLIIVVDRNYVLYKKNIVIGKKLRIALYVCLTIIIASSYLVVFNDNLIAFFTDISHTFGARFAMSKQAIEQYGIQLLGRDDVLFTTEISQEIGGSDRAFFTVDNMYIYLPLIYGILASLFFFAMYYYCFYHAIENNNHYLVAVFIVFAIYAVSELSLNTFYATIFYILALCDRKC